MAIWPLFLALLARMFGLKKVKNRRDDALSRTSWQDFESLLADHYRNAGYAVEHVGTGRSGSRFDGGIQSWGQSALSAKSG